MEMEVYMRRPSHRLVDNAEMDLAKDRIGSCEMDSYGLG
jgi:hypothetical protein